MRARIAVNQDHGSAVSGADVIQTQTLDFDGLSFETYQFRARTRRLVDPGWWFAVARQIHSSSSGGFNPVPRPRDLLCDQLRWASWYNRLNKSTDNARWCSDLL